MNDKFNDYIDSHPREVLILVVIGLGILWQSMAVVLALILYVIFIRMLSVSRVMLAVASMIVLVISIYLQHLPSISKFIVQGFHLNFCFWQLIFKHEFKSAMLFMIHYEGNYILGFSLIIASILSIIDLIANNPHRRILDELQKGTHSTEVEIKEKQLNKMLTKFHEEQFNGTLLGVSKYTGKPLVIPDRDVNQVLLVLGTTGSGKTITLRRFYQRAIRQNYPLIIVDGKPDEANIAWIKRLSDQYKRSFVGFNCDNRLNYDCLSNGSYTELKDKIICLKDQWENDYYRSVAEDYLQTTLEVLIKSGKPFDLKKIVHCLSYKNLRKIASETDDQSLKERVMGLKEYDHQEIKGLQAHLHILIHSELGQYFEKNDSSFTLSDVVANNSIVYFALPALRFPSFSKVLGKLVINDIKALIDRRAPTATPIFTVFDEFSVFAGEQVLNLVNMGRGKGIHAVFGTQGLADLERVDVSFKEQVLNCTNTLICHRLNDQASAEGIANWIGTQDAFTLTAQLDKTASGSGLGSVRRNKEFIVHPDAIKQGLKTGEAFYVSKVGGFRWEKVRIINLTNILNRKNNEI